METVAKRHLFAPSVVRKCSFTIEYAAFAAELKNKNIRFFCTRSQVMQNSQMVKLLLQILLWPLLALKLYFLLLWHLFTLIGKLLVAFLSSIKFALIWLIKAPFRVLRWLLLLPLRLLRFLARLPYKFAQHQQSPSYRSALDDPNMTRWAKRYCEHCAATTMHKIARYGSKADGTPSPWADVYCCDCKQGGKERW